MFDEERTGRPLRTARRACRDAIRDLHTTHRWMYFDSDTAFTTTAQQTEGTIEFDYTGGSSELLLTLTDSTFPSDARQSKIVINDRHYNIDNVLTTTTATLDPNDNPGEDVAAGTSYKIYRESYPLPIDCAEIGVLIDLTNNREVPILGTDEQVAIKELCYDTPDTPWHACIRNSGEYLNSMDIVFVPPPSSAIRYRLTYQRAPRPLNTELYSTGTVSVSSGSTSVSITTGSFSSAHIGCIIRFGDASDAPTSIFGGIDGTDNPFVDQAAITAVATDGTSCTIDTAVSQAYSGVKYTVSDPVDIDVNVMLTALQRSAEAKYSVSSKRNMETRRDREELARVALILAMEKDNRALYSQTVAYYDPFNRVNVTDEA